MPPRSKPQPRADEIAKVRDWIKAGAKNDGGAAAANKPIANAGKKKGDREPVVRKRGDRRKRRRGDDDDRGRGGDDDDDRGRGGRKKRERD
jgi:hypothetical protein